MSGDADLSIPLAKSLVEVARTRMWSALDAVTRVLSADGLDWRERLADAQLDLTSARITLAAAQDQYVQILETELSRIRSTRAA